MILPYTVGADMSVKNYCVVALCATLISATSVSSADLADGVLPSEFPPSGYSGNQFVDSAGCIFVRAGSGAAVRWVPRVQRNRKVLCGYTPTFAQAAPVATTPRVVATAPTVTSPVVTPPRVSTPQVSPLSVTPRVVTTPTVRTATAPTPTRRAWWKSNRNQALAPTPTIASPIVSPTARSTTPTVTVPTPTLRTTSPSLTYPQVKAPVAPVLRAPVVRTQPTIPGAGACAGSSYATAFKNARGDVAVRCGPQAVHPSDYAKTSSYSGQSGSLFDPLISPNSGKTAKVKAPTRASYRAPLYAEIAPPKGYTNLWQDDRQNTMRAVGTAQGDAEMRMVWTDTLPRRLVGSAPPKNNFWN